MALKLFTEDDLEQSVLAWFKHYGYEHQFGPDISPNLDGSASISIERQGHDEVILKNRLLNALKRINPKMPDIAIDQAVKEILIPKQPSLVNNNFAFHKYLTDGISVNYQGENNQIKSGRVLVIDDKNIDNNDFLVVNQFTVIENHHNKRPDIVLFINGIPLVVFELKTPSDDKVSIQNAYRQIKNYQSAISSLFIYNAFNVISDGYFAQVGTITSGEDRYTSWRLNLDNTISDKDVFQLETLVKGMFEKHRLIDLIKQFILFQQFDKTLIKILAGYHQFKAVNTALENTLKAASDKGDRRIGVLWHTQGSGKSLSMVFYCGKLVLSQALENPTIVVITDRNDLDDQLFLTFGQSIDLLRTKPMQADSRQHLRELLNGRGSGGIIFTTIQKFSPEDEKDAPLLTDRKNVIVLADEAHRSQYGFAVKIKQTLDSLTEKYGYAKYMRDSLPNASYVGFTGTPIETTDKNTKAVFGEYIDIYDMTRAVEDGTTVKIFYESRIVQLNLKNPEVIIDEEFEDITEKEEATTSQVLKSKWSRLEAIVGAKERINTIAKDIVEHFENRQQSKLTQAGKGMIVTMSRRIAIELYDAIIAIRPAWHSDDLMKGKIKVVMTGSSSDPVEWQKHVGNKHTRETLSRRMKDVNDELELVIVRDMWLTGFDVPSMHTMYIDKPMQGHNLMQAIARVNRVFKEKEGGLVVDYIGIAEPLKRALDQYTDQDRQQTGVDTEQAAQIMLEKLEIIHDMLHKYDYQPFFTSSNHLEKLKIITGAIEHILALDKKQKEAFITTTLELMQSYSLCSTTQVAKKHNLEIGLLKTIRAGLLKVMNPPGQSGKTSDQLDAELNQLIAQSLASNGVIDVLGQLGEEKPNLSILSEEFLARFKTLPYKNIALELLKRLILGKISKLRKLSIVQSKKFSEMLSKALERYQERVIDSAAIIQELIDLAKEITNVAEKSHNSGLSEDEYAFYEALASNITAQQIMGTDVLKDIARELTAEIKKNTTIDWTLRSSVKAQMRFTIKKLLIKYKYPPDEPVQQWVNQNSKNYDKSVKLIMDQTELLASNSVDNL